MLDTFDFKKMLSAAVVDNYSLSGAWQEIELKHFCDNRPAVFVRTIYEYVSHFIQRSPQG